MRILLRKSDIHLIDIEQQYGDEIMYRGTVRIDNKSYPFYWRSKSMKSILQKLWQTAEYSNQDALRDTLGMTIIIPDDASINDISKIMSVCQKLMPHYGYVVKNRGMLEHEDFERILNESGNHRKRPICYTSSNKNRTTNNTNPHLRNIAFSGFTKISGS